MAQSAHQRFHYKDLTQLRADLDRLGLSLPIADDVTVLADAVAIGARKAPNRFAVLPMEGFDAALDGAPQALTFRRYTRYAAGGAGLIWFEATAILPEARSNPAQLWLHRGNVDVYRRLVEETRRAARAAFDWEPVLIVQLTHSGRYSKPAGVPAPMIAHHSAVLDPLHKLSADYPLVTDDYLDRLQDNYVEAARLAAEAGFDGVDIKSCHRYLLSELLASFTREGKYGGSFENRTRMLRETIQRVAAAVPGVFVTVRLNTYDGMPYPYGFGVDRDDCRIPDPREPLALIDALRSAGIPVISPSIGNPYYIPHLNRPYDFPIKGAAVPDEHPLVGVARYLAAIREVQQAFPALPVIGSGYSWLRHLMPYVAAGVVRTGGATLIGQGRGSFAYPEAVRDIIRTGRMDPAKCCVACSACTQIMRDGGRTGCVVRDSEIYGPQYRLGRRFAMDRLQEEARRCRECEQPTCAKGCPAGIDIPRFLKAFADGDLKTAYGVLREKNALPEMCADVCPKQEQCEGNCVEKIFCAQPVAIGDIQLVTAKTARLQGVAGVKPPDQGTGKNVAVVGGGPAGVACAVRLLEAGHTVTLYEKGHALGGMPERLIPAERYGSAKAEMDAVLAPALAAKRLRISYGSSLGDNLTLASLRAEHAAVFLATGLAGSASLGAAAGVVDALAFLAAVKQGEMSKIEGRVAVVGGGNTAVDAAVTAKRLGAEDVYLVYRRSYLQMPAWEEDRALLLKHGVEPLFLTQPLDYETADGKLTGLKLVRTELGPADDSGRRRPQAVPGSESVLPVAMVIEAMGQAVPAELRAALADLMDAGADRLAVQPGSSATNARGVFAGGDLVNGGRTVVQAVAEGMQAAAEIDAYLRTL